VRQNAGVSKHIYDLVGKNRAYLLFGNPDVKVVGDRVKNYNSAFLVSPSGSVLAQYNKVHPVPLWEVMPARAYLPFLKNTASKGVYDPGNELTVFSTPKGKFSALICYEGIYTNLARKFVGRGAQFLVNISNDSWSKSEAEHYQHASMDVFRAVENGVYYVRVGNSGVTEVIDPFGRIVSSLPIYKSGYLVADIGLKEKDTVYSVLGDYFGYLSMIISIGMLGAALMAKGIAKNEA
jgi:apolipoprotein N-acyltransferase